MGGNGQQISAPETEAAWQYFDFLQYACVNHSPESRAADAKQFCGSRHSHQ